jgi:hypothetical protein
MFNDITTVADVLEISNFDAVNLRNLHELFVNEDFCEIN